MHEKVDPLTSQDGRASTASSIVTGLAKLLPVMLAILLLVGLTDALVLALQFWWPGRIPDDPTSGVWTALAVDYAQGYLYRPLVSDLGYGGTRYMPLYFMYLGTLVAYGMDPIVAGVIAMQTTVAATMTGIVVVLRRAGVSLGWALPLALVTLCTTVFQHYVTETNCEYLATALSLFAFALYLLPNGAAPGPARLLLIALLCCLGFYTKLTTLYVPAALLLHLLLTRQWRSALFFSVSGLATLTGLFLLFQSLSHDLMWANIASAITGGTPPDYVLGFFSRFLTKVVISNPAVGVTALMALVVCLMQWRAEGATPFVLVFMMTLLSTILIFTSRGIDGNHVIALHAFSLVMIGTCLSSDKLRAILAIGFFVLTGISIASLIPSIDSPRVTLELTGRETIAQLKSAIARNRHDTRPIASDDGAVSALFGERAPILDYFNLSNSVLNDPAIAADLKNRLAAKPFSILALKEASLLESDDYVEIERVGRFRILVPRSQ